MAEGVALTAAVSTLVNTHGHYFYLYLMHLALLMMVVSLKGVYNIFVNIFYSKNIFFTLTTNNNQNINLRNSGHV